MRGARYAFNFNTIAIAAARHFSNFRYCRIQQRTTADHRHKRNNDVPPLNVLWTCRIHQPLFKHDCLALRSYNRLPPSLY